MQTPYLGDDSFSFEESVIGALRQAASDQRMLYEELRDEFERQEDAGLQMMLRLASVAEFRNDESAAHIVRIGCLAEELARLAGWSSSWCTAIRMAALLHDIGKLAIADATLLKPGPLTEAERVAVNRHCEVGAHLLSGSTSPVLKLAAEIARTHHEHFDGSGYPQGLQGREIPLSGRIVALVDFFDVLAMDRCYRPRYGDDQIFDMIVSRSGRQFDPTLVDLLIANAPHFRATRDHIGNKPVGVDILRRYQSLPR